MSSRNDLKNAIRDDERRRRDEVRVSMLHTQLDEMRSQMRELVHRQGRGEEQFKHYEAGLAELRAALDQHRHEVAQSAQVRQLEDTRIRDQLSELDARFDEMNRPIRALQSHVAEALEAIRRGRDEDQEEKRRYEELKSLIENVASLAERNSDGLRSVRDSIDGLRAEHAQHGRDLVQLDDTIRIVEQDARRRDMERDQRDDVLDGRLSEMAPLFDQHQAQLDDLRDAIKHVDPMLDNLRRSDEAMREEVGTIYAQARERDEAQSERIDELRVQLDASMRDVRQSLGDSNERANDRFDDHLDRLRALQYQQSMIEMKIDELTDVDLRIRREVWHLHEMRTRQRLDQIQRELEHVVQERRDADLDATRETSARSDPGQADEEQA